MPSTVKNHVSTIRGLKESPHAMALRALRSITKTIITAVQVTEVPRELLFGELVDFHRWSLVLNDEALKELSEQATSGKQYFIDCNATNLSGMFRKFWNPITCPSGLLEFNISAAVEITDFGITLVARSSPHLRSLNISGCIKITDIGLREVALTCTKLQSLNISSCSKIEGNGLLAVAEKCPHLSNLSMSKCPQIQNWSLQRIFRKCFRLEQVRVSHMRDITDEEIRVMAENCPDITSFIAVECPYLSDQCVLSLTQSCRDLDIIDLTRSEMTYRVSDVALMALGQRATSLRILRLNNCDTITDVGLGWLAEGCHVLEVLELFGCKKITDAGLRVLGTHCHALTELDISHAKSLSDVGLSSLSRGCRALKKLKFPGAIYLSDPRLLPMSVSDAKTKELVWEEHIGVMALTIHCPGLEILDVSGCFRLNKVFQYGIGTLVHLRTLHLQGCNQVVPTSLIGLAAGCTQLEELNISDCAKGVNNEVLLAFSQRCLQLKNLICCRNKEVKGLGIKAISNMRSLEKLDLTGCSSLNDSMLVHISATEKVPQLTELNLSQLPKITDSILAWIAMKDHKVLTFNMKGTPISAQAVQSVRDRFQDSEIVTNETFFGFQPKFRVQDRVLVNKYHRMIMGITKVQARIRKVRAIRRVQSMQYNHRLLYSQALLQRIARGMLARRRVREIRRVILRYETASTHIVRLFRIVVAKKKLRRLRYQKYQRYVKQQAIRIQLIWRCFRDKCRLQHLRDEKARAHDRRVRATIVMQSVGRMYLAKCFVDKRRELQRMRMRVLHRKAGVIQRCYRGYHARLVTKQYKALLESLSAAREVAAIAIQRVFRRHRTMRIVRERAQIRYHRLACVVRIQSLMRGALARLHAMETKYELSLIRRRLAVVKIQCLWRVFKARSTFFERIKERTLVRTQREAAATVINRAVRMKLAWTRFLQKRREYLQRMRNEAERVIKAATTIQALIRRYLGRLAYFRKIQDKKTKWRELFDEEKQQRFFYNKQTGEIRWRIPQDLLDLIPHPHCDDCAKVEAALECRVCNELYCGDCFARVHQGGRRKEHEFRALYDFYGKRLDYGDGDFPCQWPSEVIQDEVQGWMLRVAPYRHPARVYHRSGWEEYELANDLLKEKQLLLQKKSMLGRTLEQHRVRSSLGKDNPKVFYFNRNTFATSYVMPPEVEAELHPPQPPPGSASASSAMVAHDAMLQRSFSASAASPATFYQTTNAAGETQYYMMSYPNNSNSNSNANVPMAMLYQTGGGDASRLGTGIAPQTLFASQGSHSHMSSSSAAAAAVDPSMQYYLQLAMGTGFQQQQLLLSSSSAPGSASAQATRASVSAGAMNSFGAGYDPQQQQQQQMLQYYYDQNYASNNSNSNNYNYYQQYEYQQQQQQQQYSSSSRPPSHSIQQQQQQQSQYEYSDDEGDEEDQQQHDVDDEEEEEEEDEGTESVVDLEDDGDYATPPNEANQSQPQPPPQQQSRGRGTPHVYRSYNAADLQLQQQQQYEQQQKQQQQQSQLPRSILKKDRAKSMHADVNPEYYHDMSSESASISSLSRK